MGKGKRVAVVELEAHIQGLLRACEDRIDRATDDAWHALKTIHDDKLYKADGYGSFQEYVEQRWGYSKSRAYQMIDHAKIIDYLKAEGVGFLPGGEGLTRPISKIRRQCKTEDEFLQKASFAWRGASDLAPKAFDVPQVTVSHVESAMEHLGVYRNAKSTKGPSVAAELRAALTKVGKSEALKLTPEQFVKRFADKGLPSDFFHILEWMRGCAELITVEQVGAKT